MSLLLFGSDFQFPVFDRCHVSLSKIKMGAFDRANWKSNSKFISDICNPFGPYKQNKSSHLILKSEATFEA